tara:strand:+ start:2832 stop:3869 length:1038 start_codon:yes stop_codon:yes gene_type:complete
MAEDSFRIYSASRTTSQLWIVEAKSNANGLTLEVVEKLDLGFAGSTIVSHPEKPLVYVSVPSGKPGQAPGAVIHLDREGEDRITTVNFNHGYSYLSLDRANHFLLGCAYGGGQVDVYELDADGVPAKRVAFLDEGRKNAHCVLPSIDNSFVYIPYVKDTNALFQYQFDPESGALTALEPKNANPPEGSGPRHMAYHPTLPFVYFSNEQNLGVSVYRKLKSGQLEMVQICDAVGPDESKEGVSSSDIVITPDGKYLFAGIRGHKRDFDRISRYRIKSDGQVELLGLTPTDPIPWGFALSPEGKFLVVTAFKGASLNVYRLVGEGGLENVATMPWEPNISDVVTRKE